MAVLPKEFYNQETRLVKVFMVGYGSTWVDVLFAVLVTFEFLLISSISYSYTLRARIV